MIIFTKPDYQGDLALSVMENRLSVVGEEYRKNGIMREKHVQNTSWVTCAQNNVLCTSRVQELGGVRGGGTLESQNALQMTDLESIILSQQERVKTRSAREMVSK